MMFAPAAVVGMPGATEAMLLPYRCMGLFIAVFGVGYAIVASDPSRQTGIVRIGVIGKLGFVMLMTIAWTTGVIPMAQFASSLADLPWVVAFLLFLRRGGRA